MSKVLTYYDELPKPAKAGFWFTICNVLQRGIQFMVVPLYTRLLSADGYGYYSVFIAWMNIFMVLATLNISGGIYYNGMLKYEGFSDKYTSSVLSLGSLSTIVVFAFITVLYPQIDDFMGLPYSMVAIMFLIIFVNQALLFWSAQQRLQYLYKTLIVVTLVNSLLAPILGVCFILFYNLGYEGAIYGYASSNIIIGGFLFMKLFARSITFYVPEYWKYTLKLCLPLIPHYLSIMLLGQLSRIMVQYYCGPDIAGIYSLAYQVSLIMNLVISGVNNALTPWMYQKLKDNLFSSVREVTNILVTSISLGAAITMFVSPEIVKILGTQEYLQAVWIIPPVLFSTVITFIYCLYGTILFFYERTVLVALATSSGAILNIILNILFIPRYGFVAAAYTTVASYFTLYIFYRLFSTSTLHSHDILFSQIFDIKNIRIVLLCLSATTIIALISFLLPFYFRYLFVLMIIMSTIKNKSLIIDTFRKVKNR